MIKKQKKLFATVLTLSLILTLCSVSIKPKETVKAATTLHNPTIDSNDVTSWDCVYFGRYWQSDTNGDGKADQNDEMKAIKWRVLSVNGEDAFLLADQNLEVLPYNNELIDVTWETCTLRTWLNETFCNTAFTTEEQEAIKNTTVINDDNPEYGTEGGADTTDKVYLLSISEASNTAYGFCEEIRTDSKTRVSTNTAYVAGIKGMNAAGEGDYWWFRSPGYNSKNVVNASENGYGNFGGAVTRNSFAVRPVLHLTVSSSLWRYAGKVDFNGETSDVPSEEPPTPTPTVTPTETPTAVPTETPTEAPTSTPTVTPTVSPTATPTVTPTAIPTTTPAVTQTAEPTVVPTIAPVNQPEKTSAPVSDNNRNGKISGKKTLPKVILRTPKNIKGKKIIVRWNAVKGAKGYQVEYAVHKKFKKKKSVWTKKKKITIRKLKKKTYYIRVRAYVTNGRQKNYSKWSKVRKVKVKR